MIYRSHIKQQDKATQAPIQRWYETIPLRGLAIVALMSFLVCSPAFATEEEEVVKQFVNAFNQRDINSMLSMASPNMKWISVSGHSLSTETSSHEELKEAMLAYFKSTPTAKSRIRNLSRSGPFVYALEEASWVVGGTTKSQCSMAVYEFINRKIKHVWYFPAHQCNQ